MTDEPKYMRLADGTLIDVRTGQRVVSTEINKAFSDRPETSILSKTRRTDKKSHDEWTRRFIDDLGVSPNQSRAVAAVITYSIFGLAPVDIAYILGTEVENIESIQQSEGYSRILEGVLQNVREHDQDKVRRLINASAEKAAQKIVDLASSNDAKVALSASKDILDRNAMGGNADLSSRNNSSFTIRIVDDRDNPADKVKVDIDA